MARGRKRLYNIDEVELIRSIEAGDTFNCIAANTKVPKYSLAKKIQEMKLKYNACSLVQLVIIFKNTTL